MTTFVQSSHPRGNMVHGNRGQFAYKTLTEADPGTILAPAAARSCSRCGADLHLEDGCWVDPTGSDGCQDRRHAPSTIRERERSTIRRGDVIATLGGALRVDHLDLVGDRAIGYDQDGEWDAVDIPLYELVPIVEAPDTADGVLSGTDRDLFTTAAIDELHRRWEAENAASDQLAARKTAEQISLARAKRLADLTATLWPDAVHVLLEDDTDGNPNLHLAGVEFGNADRLKTDLDDPRFLLMANEVTDLYRGDAGWHPACAQSGPYWKLTVEEARRIDGLDLERGLYDPLRAGRR